MKKETRGRKRKLTALEEQMIYDMHKEGANVTEIAYKNNISTRTVNRIVQRIKTEEEK